jgi:predicted site-specific integrase-resolvase
MTTTDAPSRALLTRRELADLLRVSLSTVDRLRVRGVIRPVQLVPNGRVGYRVEDVEALFDAPPEPHPARPSELEWH